MQVAPSEAIMVAAHAYDLRAAKTVWVFLPSGYRLPLPSLNG